MGSGGRTVSIGTITILCRLCSEGHTVGAFPTLTPGLVVHRGIQCPEGCDDVMWSVSHERSGMGVAHTRVDNPEGMHQLAHLLGECAEWTQSAETILAGSRDRIATVLRAWGAIVGNSRDRTHPLYAEAAAR